MSNKLSTITILVAVGFSAVACGGQNPGDTAVQNSPSKSVMNHPARACHLSKQAVANWGETSAHLPAACTYGSK
jgi:hypothetical protein